MSPNYVSKSAAKNILYILRSRSAGFDDLYNPCDIVARIRTRVDRYTRVQQCAASKQKMRSSVYTAGRPAVRPSVRPSVQQQQIPGGSLDDGLLQLTLARPFSLHSPLVCSFSFSSASPLFLPISLGGSSASLTSLSSTGRHGGLMKM